MSHIQQKPDCRRAFNARLQLQVDATSKHSSDTPAQPTLKQGYLDVPLNTSQLNADNYENFAHNKSGAAAHTAYDPGLEDSEPPSKRARVEDVDEDGLESEDNSEFEAGGLPKRPFVDYPTPGSAGATKGQGKTLFETIHEARKDMMENNSLWAPFENEDEWTMARWLMRSGLSHAEIDRFLKLEITRNRSALSFKNKASFFKKIDALPRGPEWRCEMWEALGDELDDSGERRTEILELWMRDPVKCIQDLLSNPVFEEDLHYGPERIFEDPEKTRPIFGETWTGEWWEETQKLLPAGATVVPVILASDKTQLSTFSGDKSAWPSKRSAFGYQLFHDCMRSLLAPLVEAGKSGVDVVCADGFIRQIFPILAAYIADHPEQCLVACCQENFCPKCLVSPDKRGLALHSLLRDPDKTISLIEEKLSNGRKLPEFEEAGLRAIRPFWADLPHCNIFSCITPDILHQLHKGMFKDHTVKWATACMSGKENEVDRRFQGMPLHPDLRHFRKGISLVSQWTGTEYKHMEKVFLGVIAGAVIDPEVVKAVRAVLDFIHYAHFEMHTEESLAQLEAAWLKFHTFKRVFVRLKVRKDFSSIPKLHSMTHYVHSIRLLGTADGYSTEGPERLHIDFAKIAYRASNRKCYIQQMTVWLERQDAVRRFEDYLTWLGHRCTTDQASDEDEGYPEVEDTPDHAEPDEESATEIKTAGLYKIAKTPAFPKTTIRVLEQDFGTLHFTECLETFVHAHTVAAASRSIPPLPITSNTLIPAFKQFKIELPPMTQVSKSSTWDVIRAHPAKPISIGSAKSATPMDCSTVLARERSSTDHTASNGLTVGRVRAIFRLPKDLCQHARLPDHPLAYIEWFTGFQKYDADLGLFSVAPSRRNHHRRASIISITNIERTCHLIPQWGQVMDTSWTSSNVLDRCSSFYVNPYLRHSDFVIFRLLVDRWRKAQARRKP
ncbi:hypothetical protein BDW22DRAFT_1460424 [Trametopsis cervina]|nr:hypothetical protein BDW22DRAFT_1460424 [Trametopsis cervina]